MPQTIVYFWCEQYDGETSHRAFATQELRDAEFEARIKEWCEERQITPEDGDTYSDGWYDGGLFTIEKRALEIETDHHA